MLKHTIALLLTIVVAEVMSFGNLVLSSNVDVPTNSEKSSMMAVSEPVYVPEEAVTVEKAAVEIEDTEEPDGVEEWSDYGYYDENIVYYDYADYGYDDGYSYEAPSYDGSGYTNANVDGVWISGADFMFNGVHQDSSGYSYSWYPERVLPGGGLNIPGRHVGDEGYVVDGDGNLCVASDDLPYGTVVSVPFGSGTAVVYDCGGGHGNLDVYTSW